MQTLVILLAQVDPVSGGAGWVGAGLLGLVLSWLLLKHLPDVDKKFDKLLETFREEREADRKARREDQDSWKLGLNQVCSKFESEQEKCREGCQRNFETIAGAVQRGMEGRRRHGGTPGPHNSPQDHQKGPGGPTT